MFSKCSGFMVGLGLSALLYGPTMANAAPSIDLGTAGTYGVLSDTFSNSNTSPYTIINGDVGCTTCDVPLPLSITGALNTPKPAAAGIDQGLALAALNAPACDTITNEDDIAAMAQPLNPGVYCFTGAVSQTLGTTVTLNGNGVYIFRINGALTTGANDIIALTGGAQAGDVFWVPVGAASIGANNTFVGTIVADAGITLGHFTSLHGRALAFATTVTTDANTITVPTSLSVATNTAIPTLSGWAMIALTLLLVLAGVETIRRRNISTR